MASKEGQIDLKGMKCQTSEGISKDIEIQYTLPQWTQNMRDYLKSAMSYCNAKTLGDFIGKVQLTTISNNAQLAINQ